MSLGSDKQAKARVRTNPLLEEKSVFGQIDLSFLKLGREKILMDEAYKQTLK